MSIDKIQRCIFILIILLFNIGLVISQHTTSVAKKSIALIENSNTTSDPLKPDYQVKPLIAWEEPFTSFKFEVFRKNKHQLPYRFYRPEEIRKGQKYPLVIFMHGNGERGLDNRGQFERFSCVKFWEKFPCYVIAPQCPPRMDHIPNSELVWVDTPFGDSAHTMKPKPTWPMQLTQKLLAQIISNNQIDCSRIYVTGLSMGGFATWELIQRNPSMFAAAIPVCGGGDVAFASKLIHIPLWTFHGDADKTVVVERSRNMINAIKGAGGDPKYTEYSAVSHDCWGRTYSNPEVWDWLFAQTKK